ncbi:MAG TPA: streptomycin biosynthesis protein StrI, partial [Planctomycetaceae bacterium]|nr:streptomycin biosynthesis protein StrI [Planctomycetaceae bacterium]
MAKNFNQKSDRRQFIKTAAAVSALSNIAIPRVHAQEGERNEIRVALIGSGGRGTGATADALKVESTKLKLVAMADVFEHRISKSYDILKEHFSATPEKIDVPPDQQFVGFDAYRHAMDVLRPGDIAIFASPLAFRPLHLEYAIKRGLHVFMEKPIVADGVSAKKMF